MFLASDTLMNDSPLSIFEDYPYRLHQRLAFRSPVSGDPIVQVPTPQATRAVIVVPAAGDGLAAVAAAVFFLLWNNKISPIHHRL